MKRRACWILMCAGLLSCLIACSTSKTARFYTLNPVKSAPSPANQERAKSDARPGVGILPVEIPDYLDRSQIVTRNSGSGLEIAEFDRWAGELQDDVARTVAETLSAQFPESPVYIITGGVRPCCCCCVWASCCSCLALSSRFLPTPAARMPLLSPQGSRFSCPR